ncbi:hypothetical protein QEN19_002477 [Hanseniaspora menglaensis]
MSDSAIDSDYINKEDGINNEYNSNYELDDFDNNVSLNSYNNRSKDVTGLEDEEDDDEEDAIKPRLRNRQPVNYKSTKYIVDEDEDNSSRHRKRGRLSRNQNKLIDYDEDDDDEEFMDENGEDENEEDEFQITSDYSDEDEFGYKRRRRPLKNTRAQRYKKHRALKNFIDDEEDDNEEEEEDSLIEDLHDLAKENDAFSSPKRNLRERQNKVNYELPHPDSDINVFNKFSKKLEDEEESERGLKSKATNTKKKAFNGRSTSLLISSNDYPLRRLYQTSGPFGGNNTVSLINKFDHAKRDEFKTELEKETVAKKDSLKTEIIKADLTQPLLVPPNNLKNKNHKYTPKLNGLESDSSSSSSDEQVTADTDPIQIPKETSFNDIGGLDNYITQLKEMITLPLLYPELYTNFNIQPPRGVLFHGPPGTGKTLMARALAAQSSKDSNTKITFYMRKGSDILSKWVGEAERQLRLLFEQAASTQPSIIFFDELDGLAPVRSSKQEQIHSSIVSTLLALMDGMDSRGQVVVIGATNRPDSLDPALRRGGRFDREFYFGLPSKDARLKILQIHTEGWKNIDPEVLESVSDLTNGFGGADLKQLCVEAALGAVMRTFPQIYTSTKDLQKLKVAGKYKVDVNEVIVNSGDFNRALEKINPSSARQGGASSYEKLPFVLEPLLKQQEQEALNKLDNIFPILASKNKKTTLIDHYVQNEIKNTSFNEFQLMKNLLGSRFNKPLLFIRGSGSEYVANALLHKMDNVNIQSLSIPYLHSDLGKSIDSAIVSAFNEAKRRQPSVIHIPNSDVWVETINQNLPTFEAMLKTIKFEEKVLVLLSGETISSELKHLFKNKKTIFDIKTPTDSQLKEYFESNLKEFLMSPPSRFETFKKRTIPLPELPIVEEETIHQPATTNETELDKLVPLRKYLELYKRIDMKLKNKLKVKLAGLMDLLKVRYKKFKKPLIEDESLVTLFESSPFHTPVYILEGSRVKDTTTNIFFTNMDLDTIEERLWNGFYSEPKQFFKDIMLIYDDAIVTKVRERIISASEMVANCDVFIDEMLLPNEVNLAQEWKNCKKRDDLREKLKIVDGIDVYTLDGLEADISQKKDADYAVLEDVNALKVVAEINESNSSIEQEDVVNIEPAEVIIKEVLEPIDLNILSKPSDGKTKIEDSDTVSIDTQKFDECISQLVVLSETMTIDDLQNIVSEIINFLWPYRLEHDKNIALEKLQEYINDI